MILTWLVRLILFAMLIFAFWLWIMLGSEDDDE